MKLVRNTGTDRVIDLLRPGLRAGRQLDVMTPAFSLFAFSEMLHEVTTLVRCRLLLPPSGSELRGLRIGCRPHREESSAIPMGCKAPRAVD